MIERIWSGRSRLYLLLLPLSLLYGLVSSIIRLSYRLGLRRCWRAPVPVVVVGNLTAGGNGKTPVVIWLVEALKRKGLRPGVVSRGYGGSSTRYPLLLRDDTAPEQAGDEPVLIYSRCRVPVAVSPVRCDAVRLLLENENIDIVITDDGLQHYALGRDKEIVVIDGERRFGNGWWLPAGPMRERASRLATVDAVIMNGGSTVENAIAMGLIAGCAINLLSGEQRPVSLFKNVVAIAGIGHPPRFFATLRQQGIQPVKEVAFADHQAYCETDLAALLAPGQSLLMTEKDAVKCRAFAHPDWWYVPVEADFNAADAHKLTEMMVALCRSPV